MRASQSRQTWPSSRSFLRSWPIEPNRARITIPPATIRLRGLPESEAWTKAQSMKLQFIGWRVIAKTPRGAGIGLGAAPGFGKAGLRINAPTRRMLAISISADATGHHKSGATQKAAASLPPRR